MTARYVILASEITPLQLSQDQQNLSVSEQMASMEHREG